MRTSFLIDGIWTTRKNDSFGSEVKLRDLLGTWEHLREDIQLSKTASDTLHLQSASPNTLSQLNITQERLTGVCTAS